MDAVMSLSLQLAQMHSPGGKNYIVIMHICKMFLQRHKVENLFFSQNIFINMKILHIDPKYCCHIFATLNLKNKIKIKILYKCRKYR